MSAKPVHNYLYFTRKYRRGSLVLLSLIALLSLTPFVYPLIVQKEVTAISLDTSLASLSAKIIETRKNNYDKRTGDYERPYSQPPDSYSKYPSKNKAELFSFDPNTLSAEGWKKLGLRDKTIATIMNFRNKGGSFKTPADIQKIWGLFPDEAERLMPYVNITDAAAPTAGKNYSKDFPERKKYEPKSYQQVDINMSDTSAWIALPGIGTKLSQRIINFRDKLGGFYSVAQVSETFGLADSTFQKIKPLLQISGEVKKLNINSATMEELKAHPYIRYHLGNAIVQYRTQHGHFKNIGDIKKIMIVDEPTYNKLSPYLSID